MPVGKRKGAAFELGKQGLLLFVIGMSLLLFLSFLLGVLVGMNLDTYPERISRGVPEALWRQLAQLERRIEQLTGPQGRDVPEGGGDNRQNLRVVTPYEAGEGEKQVPPPGIAGGTGETSASGIPAAPTRAPRRKGKKGGDGEKTGGLPSGAVAEQKREVHRQQDRAEISPSSTPAKGKGRYVLQVASFRDRERAEALSRQIVSAGYQPEIEAVELASRGTWYRVKIRGFQGKDEALQASGLLRKKIKGVEGIILSAQ